MKFTLSLSILSTILAVVDASVRTPKTKPYSQDSLEQFQLLRYTGTTGPYIAHRGFGIDSSTPEQCEVTQAHLFMRHGERYPTKGTGKAQKSILTKLKNAGVEDFKGPLAFIKDYEFFVEDDSYLEFESYKGYYSGLADLNSFGAEFRAKYDHLFDGETVHPVFVSGQERVVESARAFAQGFFAHNYTNLASIQIIPENETQGANTLTTHDACVNYNGSFNDALTSQFSSEYLERAAIRLNNASRGFNISGDDVYNLLGYCGFELNVRGESAVCEIFTQEELLNWAYSKDLEFYYKNGPGYDLSTPLGHVFANNTYTLLKQGKEYPYNLTFSFSHDSDLLTYTTALGIFEPDYDLSVEEIEFGSIFRSSEIIPMGGRLSTEKLSCKDVFTNETEDFVRLIANDAVIPIPGCQSGPGFSCSLDGYKKNLDERLGNTTYVEACGVNETYPQYTTFYWDFDITFDDN
ncbi:Repressible acid phosphatase [Wickerhamomyces ciferrii]|uniref:acid phosphatase n=1 Tax=Wickerhamomyces ciferrii (strain ATCC 14091 / BCRC 22168 / CBS 111 / JCM 3599 / NBRC 0793 / NRRL Y-1031 F-60-10) TaxID=1206466 RepID=K0KTL3_WICCF|nr:Repressible acid phosphatase [Wickerhamomyces ciferrii]CCH44613.1 Repressible acid phosphatase [Wickerhamomyces ciferrii]